MTRGHGFEPSLTYANTSGWSGTETSKRRAFDNDEKGHTAHVQRDILMAVASKEERGATVAELRMMFPHNHHGSISSALTNLHRDGRLVRLQETRERCKVYVIPDCWNGRPFEPPITNVRWKERAEKLAVENENLKRRLGAIQREVRKWQTQGQMVPIRKLRQILDQ